MKEEKKINESRLAIKLIMCLVYLIVMTILFVCAYRLYEQKETIVSWSEVESVEDYTYITISRMSEKFAYYQDVDIGIHFVIEKEDTGEWHTYLIAIKEKDYNKYKKIIDYSYERIETEPNSKKVYGYPVIVSDELKELAIKNIDNFIPADNEIEITSDNYEEYLTNSYLDTTQAKQDNFSPILFVTLVLLFITFCLFVATIFNKDRIVDKVDTTIDKEVDRARLMFERAKKIKNNKRNK